MTHNTYGRIEVKPAVNWDRTMSLGLRGVALTSQLLRAISVKGPCPVDLAKMISRRNRKALLHQPRHVEIDKPVGIAAQTDEVRRPNIGRVKPFPSISNRMDETGH